MKRKDTFIQADSMGMGKTAQTLEYMRQTTDCHFIVVCPSSLKCSWCNEIKYWLDIDVKPDVYTGQVIVTNYERIENMIRILGTWIYQFSGVVFDEAHALKNITSQRTLQARKLVELVGNPMLLTGTPILNKPNDLIGLLYVGGKLDDFGGESAYRKRYIPTLEKDNAIFFSNVSHLTELRQRITPFICRRTWADIHRPQYHTKQIDISLGQFADYPPVTVDITDIAKTETQVVSRKLPLIITWVKQLYNKYKEPIVIFANHRRMIEELHNSLSNSSVVYGGLTHKQKQDNISAFINGDVDIIICSLACASCGLNLVRSHCVVFAEFPWTIGIYEQAVARCARQGQFHHTIYVYALVMENSYDRYRLEQMKWKATIANKIIDGEGKTDGRYFTGCVSLGIYSYIEDGSIDTTQYHGIDVYSTRFAYALGEMCRGWILAHTTCYGDSNVYWDYIFRSYLQYSFAITHANFLIGEQTSPHDELTLSQLYRSLVPLSEMIDYDIDTIKDRKQWFDTVWSKFHYPYNSWYTVYKQNIYVK